MLSCATRYREPMLAAVCDSVTHPIVRLSPMSLCSAVASWSSTSILARCFLFFLASCCNPKELSREESLPRIPLGFSFCPLHSSLVALPELFPPVPTSVQVSEGWVTTCAENRSVLSMIAVVFTPRPCLTVKDAFFCPLAIHIIQPDDIWPSTIAGTSQG